MQSTGHVLRNVIERIYRQFILATGIGRLHSAIAS